MSKIVIITPTEIEQRAVRSPLSDVEWVVSGMGATATAYTTLRAIIDYHPRLIILAGIAGATPQSGLNSGDVVQVATDRQADLGAWRSDHYQPFGIAITHATATIPELSSVTARTVNTACSPIAEHREEDQIESMEGAPFFEVCAREGVAALQIRAISNLTNQPRAEWQIETALKNLGETLNKIALSKI